MSLPLRKITDMKRKRQWSFSPKKPPKPKLSVGEKHTIQDCLQPIVEDFKKKIPKNPHKEFNYLVDVYSKWFQNYFYFCEKFKSENPDRFVDEFEEKFLRLTYTGKNQFTLSFLRHTGQWMPVVTNLTLDECKEMIIKNPIFHPLS